MELVWKEYRTYNVIKAPRSDMAIAGMTDIGFVCQLLSNRTPINGAYLIQPTTDVFIALGDNGAPKIRSQQRLRRQFRVDQVKELGKARYDKPGATKPHKGGDQLPPISGLITDDEVGIDRVAEIQQWAADQGIQVVIDGDN